MLHLYFSPSLSILEHLKMISSYSLSWLVSLMARVYSVFNSLSYFSISNKWSESISPLKQGMVLETAVNRVSIVLVYSTNINFHSSVCCFSSVRRWSPHWVSKKKSIVSVLTQTKKAKSTNVTLYKALMTRYVKLFLIWKWN